MQSGGAILAPRRAAPRSRAMGAAAAQHRGTGCGGPGAVIGVSTPGRAAPAPPGSPGPARAELVAAGGERGPGGAGTMLRDVWDDRN